MKSPKVPASWHDELTFSEAVENERFKMPMMKPAPINFRFCDMCRRSCTTASGQSIRFWVPEWNMYVCAYCRSRTGQPINRTWLQGYALRMTDRVGSPPFNPRIYCNAFTGLGVNGSKRPPQIKLPKVEATP